MTDEPNLGLATTRELLEELRVRGEMEEARPLGEWGWALRNGADDMLRMLPDKLLDYRTVHSR